jgi:hypothetical protein
MGSPDENRLKSGSKRGTGGLTGPFFAVRMKKSGRGGLCGETSGDALICETLTTSGPMTFCTTMALYYIFRCITKILKLYLSYKNA